MICKGILLSDKKDSIVGKDGSAITIRTLKIRDTTKDGDEKHVYIKCFGENGIKAELQKPIEIEFKEQERHGKDKSGADRLYINKVAVFPDVEKRA